tara:strand:- start:605 stop:1306 length:702 start_codon:yes stop_codon:yes gene_type:complete
MKDFENTFNLGDVDNFRSLKGYAGQELAFGRLMLCGFNVQRNLWRDAKYDGTFVVKEVPVKIEIKSSTRRGREYLNEFDCTSGSRAGGQIDRNAPSRTKLISKNDVDFIICVSNNDAYCWILPVEVVEITKRAKWKENYLKNFEEKFQIFISDNLKNIEIKDLINGFMKKDLEDLELICEKNNVDVSNKFKENHFEYSKDKIYSVDEKKSKKININYKESLVLDIWLHIVKSI